MLHGENQWKWCKKELSHCIDGRRSVTAMEDVKVQSQQVAEVTRIGGKTVRCGALPKDSHESSEEGSRSGDSFDGCVQCPWIRGVFDLLFELHHAQSGTICFCAVHLPRVCRGVGRLASVCDMRTIAVSPWPAHVATADATTACLSQATP